MLNFSSNGIVVALIGGFFLLVVGWQAHKLQIRSSMKEKQLVWLQKTYINFVREDLSYFFSGIDVDLNLKLAKAKEVIRKYSESWLYSSPKVVRKFRKLIVSLTTAQSPDFNAKSARELLIAMRHDLQGFSWWCGGFTCQELTEEDIEFFNVTK